MCPFWCQKEQIGRGDAYAFWWYLSGIREVQIRREDGGAEKSMFPQIDLKRTYSSSQEGKKEIGIPPGLKREKFLSFQALVISHSSWRSWARRGEKKKWWSDDDEMIALLSGEMHDLPLPFLTVPVEKEQVEVQWACVRAISSPTSWMIED